VTGIDVLHYKVATAILIKHKAQVQASAIWGAKLVGGLSQVILAGFVAAGSRDHLQCIEMYPTGTPVLLKVL
jgi:hypothetical protein